MPNSTLQLNKIVSIFRDLAARNKMINYFGYGSSWNLQAHVDKLYPYMYLEPVSSRQTGGLQGYMDNYYTFKIYIIDKINKGDSNYGELLSDCEYIIRQIIGEISQHQYYVDMGISLYNDINYTPLFEETNDNCNGWVAQLVLKLPNVISPCNSPILPITGYTTSICSNITEYRLIGATGPQGPPGATGATGSQGATGSTTYYTFTNGLTESNTIVKLGGEITEDTLINGDLTELEFNFSGSTGTTSVINIDREQINLFTDKSDGFNFVKLNTAAMIGASDTSDTNISANISFPNDPQTIINNGNDNRIIVTDNLSNKGAVYASDYSSNFTNESLITKRYVDNAILAASMSGPIGPTGATGPTLGLSYSLAISNDTFGKDIIINNGGRLIGDRWNALSNNNFINLNQANGIIASVSTAIRSNVLSISPNQGAGFVVNDIPTNNQSILNVRTNQIRNTVIDNANPSSTIKLQTAGGETLTATDNVNNTSLVIDQNFSSYDCVLTDNANNTGTVISANTVSARIRANDNNNSYQSSVTIDPAGLELSNTEGINFNLIQMVSDPIPVSDGSNNRMIVTDAIDAKGLVYLDDYTANFTDNSLITKKYVKDNFVPLSGTDPLLPVTGIIESTSNTALAAKNKGMIVGAADDLDIDNNATRFGFVNLSSDNDYSQASLSTLQGSYQTTLSLLASTLSTDAYINSTDPNFVGLQYLNDFSANYVTQSLITKGYLNSVLGASLSNYELLANKATTFSVINNTLYPTTQAVSNYVTSQISAIPVITVSNGLSKVGNDIRLGGTLSATSSINLNTFDISISNGRVNLPASTTSKASINIANGATPSSLSNGDIWNDAINLYGRIAGETRKLDNPTILVQQFCGSSFSPADSTEYYIPFFNNTALPPVVIGSYNQLRVGLCFLSGNVTDIMFTMNSTTNCSGESITVNFNTHTSGGALLTTTFAGTMSQTAQGWSQKIINGLNIPIRQGDYFSVSMAYPVLATNGVALILNCYVKIVSK